MALLADSSDITVPESLVDAQAEDFNLCAVGTFVTERNINFNAMRTQMANLWRPRAGVTITDKGEGLIMFRFYHQLDMDLVLEGGPWTFDENLLAIRSLAPGDDYTQVPLYEVDFWVLVYDLTAEFYSEVVGKALGNFLGSFILYDDTNQYVDRDSYMRIRVNLDVRKSLVKEKLVKKPTSEVLVAFKYEKLPIFRFLCGRIGHIDRACEVRFRFPRNTVLPLLWDASLRAPLRRTLREISSPWLVPTPAEQRVALLRNGGIARGTSTHERHQRPANIQALLPNFRSGLTRGPTNAQLHTNLKDAQPIQLLEDRKRQRGLTWQDSDMEVDKENVPEAGGTERQGQPLWHRHGAKATTTTHQ
ncbi:hypothetical protein LINGRAHAP2_LOCUS11213 [Linum grandiflorum]